MNCLDSLSLASIDPGGETAQASSDGDQTPDKNKKKNRCFSCRKKVGLTGKEFHDTYSTEIIIMTWSKGHELALIGFSIPHQMIITRQCLKFLADCLKSSIVFCLCNINII